MRLRVRREHLSSIFGASESCSYLLLISFRFFQPAARTPNAFFVTIRPSITSTFGVNQGLSPRDILTSLPVGSLDSFRLFRSKTVPLLRSSDARCEGRRATGTFWHPSPMQVPTASAALAMEKRVRPLDFAQRVTKTQHGLFTHSAYPSPPAPDDPSIPRSSQILQTRTAVRVDVQTIFDSCARRISSTRTPAPSGIRLAGP